VKLTIKSPRRCAPLRAPAKPALSLIVALSIALAKPAAAWEPQTTHAGLAEQAALKSRLHKRLVAIGFGGGLFEPLTIPPADAPTLAAALKLLSPTHGSVPDGRGRQSALAWIAAGAALADVPAAHGANHFLDPRSGKGWQEPDRSLGDRIRDAFLRTALPSKGIPAPQWVTDKTNPFNLDNFLSQYVKAVSAATPGERSRHMAATLIAAGAIMHALGDLGAPSRVRNDAAAHFDQLGGGPEDLGSRFERIAALAYGRLGVPAPSRTITRTRLVEYFSSKQGDGLADVIEKSYFSANTLPAPSRVSKDEKPHLARPLPAVPRRLNVMAANREEGTTLRDAAGTCLARYRVQEDVLRFILDDDCMLDQLSVILPEVAAYETGLLDFLLRGELTLTAGGQITITGENLASGNVDVFVEDERGVRTKLGSSQLGKDPVRIPAPNAGVRVVAVFRGTDTAGEPLVAVGSISLR
jgi:hypothetical protein